MIRPDLAAMPAYVPGTRRPDALKLSSNEVAATPLPAAVRQAYPLVNGRPFPGRRPFRRRMDLGPQVHPGKDFPGNAETPGVQDFAWGNYWCARRDSNPQPSDP